jgi:hypothetical protein
MNKNHPQINPRNNPHQLSHISIPLHHGPTMTKKIPLSFPQDGAFALTKNLDTATSDSAEPLLLCVNAKALLLRKTPWFGGNEWSVCAVVSTTIFAVVRIAVPMTDFNGGNGDAVTSSDVVTSNSVVSSLGSLNDSVCVAMSAANFERSGALISSAAINSTSAILFDSLNNSLCVAIN